jgi:hypothetical protein
MLCLTKTDGASDVQHWFHQEKWCEMQKKPNLSVFDTGFFSQFGTFSDWLIERSPIIEQPVTGFNSQPSMEE